MPLTDDPWLAVDGSGNIPAVRAAAPVGVFRFDGGSSLTALPNVECIGVANREGTEPGSARFRYNLASGLDGAPVSIEQALGTGFSGPLVINSGDRLVVQAQRPDGSVECLFDGIAIDFGMGLDPDFEEVQVGAVGIGWRCWDDVIPGALIRDATAPGAGSQTDTPTAVPAVFNPGGLPNCTPDGFMAGTNNSGGGGGGDQRYPTFLDPAVVRSPKDFRTYWTLPKACRYVIFNGNPTQQFVTNPDGGDLDQLLVAPIDGGAITCPDTPISGKDWPSTVNRLVAECGFGTCFQLSTIGGGIPSTAFSIFRQQGGAIKSIYLAARGTDFDPSLFNFSASTLERDLSDVVNRVTVQGGLDRYEASFVLAAGFPMATADATSTNIKTYATDSPNFLTNSNAYRLYIFDECGEGHYNVGSNTALTKSTSLDNVFGAPVRGMAQYARRRRAPIGTLISVDKATNIPYDASLYISADYDTGGTKGPGVWDGTGSWQKVTSTTWRLCQDRIGVVITDKNPETWEIGASKNGTSQPFPDGVVHGVTYQASAVTGKKFWLRLTCVIEDDSALFQVAQPTGGSPLAQPINRIVDASDRYRNEFVDYPSEFNNSPPAGVKGATLNPRNDNAAALAEATALQYGQQYGRLQGSITIPRLTTYYQIGDRIDQIEGRGLGLRTDQGTGTPIYPVVVGVAWELGPDRQSTRVEVSDAGTDRARYLRKPARASNRKSYESDAYRRDAARAAARSKSEAMARLEAKAMGAVASFRPADKKK